MTSKLEARVVTLQEEIAVTAQAIADQMEDKKTIVDSYNENIKALKSQQATNLLELKTTKEQIKEKALVAAADEILEDNAEENSPDLSLID